MSAVTVTKGIFNIVNDASKNPKAREAIGKGINALRGLIPNIDQKDNEDETTQKAQEEQAKQNEQANDKANDKTNEPPPSPEQPEKEPDDEKNNLSTKFQDAEKARQEAREAINENPEKAEGRDLGNQGKMENAQTIIENRDEYSLQNKIEEIRDATEKNEGKTWVERVTESREAPQNQPVQEPNTTPDTQLNSMDSISPAQTQVEPNTTIQEPNPVQDIGQDPSVNSVNQGETNWQIEDPTELNTEQPNDTLDAPEDKTDNSNYNPNEPNQFNQFNQFAMLEERELNFFNNDSPQVDLSELNDQDMDKFTDLASTQDYEYHGDDKEELDNVNNLEEMSFYGDDNGRDDMDDMDMGDVGGDDGGGDD
ncbi:MAG: hypothetical protein JNL70_11755 [Saprospiraceae bacterium]|nr:hypothetical protein [Saprospiraceae bacterium]